MSKDPVITALNDASDFKNSFSSVDVLGDGDLEIWFQGVKKPVTAKVEITVSAKIVWGDSWKPVKTLKVVKIDKLRVTDDFNVFPKTGWELMEVQALVKHTAFKKQILDRIEDVIAAKFGA